MNKNTIYQVDAFTEEYFKGNPAGVCVLEKPADETWMQLVALEMNLSETAFLYKENNIYQLRWFTPETEVNLCGHATLASAYVLWKYFNYPSDKEIHFMSRSGLLKAFKTNDEIFLEFPTKDVTKSNEIDPNKFLNAFNIKSGINFIGETGEDWIVELETFDVFDQIKPNFNLIKELGKQGIIVTSKSKHQNFDFVSRFFAPNFGLNEDPVTGSAHCSLCVYWCNKLNNNRLIGFQASQRGGIVKVELKNDKVILGGKAVAILKCQFL